MTNIIIVIAVIAIIALLILRARQNKESTGSAKTKSTNKNSSKTSKKTEDEVAAAPVAEVKAKPSIDLNVLITKIDLLISDKEYAKAEGLINQSLKQDSSLHPLYEKLLVIYHGQEDDFAVNQLLDTLQKQNLNELYQRIYSDHETFKAEQSKAEALNAEKKTPDVFEFTPSAQNNASSFDSLAQEEVTDNSLEFANLSSPVAPTTQDNSLEFADLTLDTPTAETNTNQSPTLDFNLSAPTEPNLAADTPTLDFKLDVPEQAAPVAEPALDFKLDFAPPSAEEPKSPTLDFNLDTPTPTAETPAINLDFSLETPTVDTPSVEAAPTTLDFNLDATPPVADDVVETQPEAQTVADQFVDANDPIMQSFTELTQVNPIDLNIELAEQYIRLGAIDAAKDLLNASIANVSSEQATKIDSLLQKIAS